VPVYKFLKDPLIRKYGEPWYNELTRVIEEAPKEKKAKTETKTPKKPKT
jgi:hypothetical protein